MNETSDVSCGEEITRSITLNKDVGPCSGDGLVITADDITVDLNGHTIIGDPTARDSRCRAGILLRGVRGVTVRNGTVTGFDAGVAIQGGGGNTVEEITAEDNVNYRVLTGRNADPDDVDVDNDIICIFGEGITVTDSSENVIAHNRVYRNGPLSGIALVGDSNDNRVAHNDVRDNDVLNQTPDGRPTTCGTGPGQGPMGRGRAVQNIGIRVEGPGADRNVIEGNRVSRSAIAGIAVHSYNAQAGTPPNDATVIRNNRVSETGKSTHEMDPHAHGITVMRMGPAFVRPPNDVTIEGNNSSHNFGHGISVAGRESRGHTIRNNVVNRNRGAGILLEGPSEGLAGVTDSTLTGNRGRNNAIDGVDGNDDCGANRWTRNRFGTVNQPCVANEGSGSVAGPTAAVRSVSAR
ncbi:MAG TPA: right-handed parallel beta-helix repeat-containing protein [Egibacteraceae bacterium]|nr:right-handed parallel beta-helix repeat-containing protein [Egibacteraceae bacterium]